jgi:hypothetical protein
MLLKQNLSPTVGQEAVSCRLHFRKSFDGSDVDAQTSRSGFNPTLG